MESSPGPKVHGPEAIPGQDGQDTEKNCSVVFSKFSCFLKGPTCKVGSIEEASWR